jgi:hypothetical protein
MGAARWCRQAVRPGPPAPLPLHPPHPITHCSCPQCSMLRWCTSRSATPHSRRRRPRRSWWRSQRARRLWRRRWSAQPPRWPPWGRLTWGKERQLLQHSTACSSRKRGQAGPEHGKHGCIPTARGLPLGPSAGPLAGKLHPCGHQHQVASMGLSHAPRNTSTHTHTYTHTVLAQSQQSKYTDSAGMGGSLLWLHACPATVTGWPAMQGHAGCLPLCLPNSPTHPRPPRLPGVAAARTHPHGCR